MPEQAGRPPDNKEMAIAARREHPGVAAFRIISVLSRVVGEWTMDRQS
jgi:hypothetical protein